jgi:hypothetical protein
MKIIPTKNKKLRIFLFSKFIELHLFEKRIVNKKRTQTLFRHI